MATTSKPARLQDASVEMRLVQTLSCLAESFCRVALASWVLIWHASGCVAVAMELIVSASCGNTSGSGATSDGGNAG